MARKPTIGKAEFALLAIIAKSDGMTVGEAHEELSSTTGCSRSTTTQMLERLRKKAFLNRRKSGGVFVYSSPRTLEQIQTDLVDELVSDVLEGSASRLLHFFQKKVSLTKAEEAELKRILAKIEKKSK